MGLVSNSVRDHCAKELDELRTERIEHLRKAEEIGREIAAVEAHEILGDLYAAAQGKAMGKTAAPPAAPAPRGKGSAPAEPTP
jgi:hypothetical protein